MKQPITRLLALLLAMMLLLLIGCSAAKDSVQEQTQAPTDVPASLQQPKCTQLGAPLADVRVRRALAHAIDMDTILEALFYGYGEKVGDFDGILEPAEYDPQLSKELLAQAGWPSDYVLDVVYYHNDQQTEDFLSVVGSYWEAVGVKAEFRLLEGDLVSQLWQQSVDGKSSVEWDLVYGAVAALTDGEVYGRFASDATNNSHTPEIPGLDDLLKQAASASDRESQKALYGQVRDLLAQNQSFIPLLHQNCFIYTSSHLEMPDVIHGNDQFAYDKNILNWTTDREDKTLYTDGGPDAFFCYPVVNPGLYLYEELVFERLIGADSSLNPTGGQLAESYTLSEDGKTLEFLLREKLLWHDEQPLTGEDVKFTFELYMKCPGANAVLTEVLGELEGAEAFLKGETEACSGITLEENKVTFRFEQAQADLMTVFSQWPVLPKHCLETVSPEELQQNEFWLKPIGSGPYQVTEVELGRVCTLERWDGYRETGEGNIERIVMRASGETDENLVALAQRDLLDYAWGKSTDDAVCMKQVEGMKVTEVKVPYTRCFFINQFDHESGVAKRAAAAATEPTEAPTEAPSENPAEATAEKPTE